MGSGTLAGNPPAAETVNRARVPLGKLSRCEAKRIFLPSGVHPATMSGPAWKVTRRGVPPLAEITYTFSLPSYSPVKAIHWPSGEKCGPRLIPGPAVRRTALPPWRLTFHRSLPYMNAMSVLLRVGWRSSSGLASCVCAIDADADASKIKRMARPSTAFFIEQSPGESQLVACE